MAASNLKIGQTIETGDSRRGVIKYIGPLHIAIGDWCGLELPDASGKNDGSVKGERYFDCEPGYGIFVRKESVVKVLKQPTSSTASVNTNGITGGTKASAAIKSRPSSIMPAETARKRQSLMSGGAASQSGSRLSMRSPTKSPTKPGVSSASSNASTPRTGTPATTARTSDSSAKSRLSTAGRPSMGPPATKPHTTTNKTLGHSSRPSINSVTAAAKTTKPNFAPARPSVGGSRMSTSSKPIAKRPSSIMVDNQPAEKTHSPTINENEEEQELPSIDAQISPNEASRNDEAGENIIEGKESQPSSPNRTRDFRTTSVSRPGGSNTAEVRAAQQKENEQLRVKLRSLEKKREEDRDKLQQFDTLQNDKDRFEGIIQALQKKLKTNQEELKSLRNKCEEVEAKANSVPERSAEFESELELATLDKEMAEERADTLQMELDMLKSKNEELELEMDVLRGENNELASTMSPEERASAGFLHLERETERLRRALILLRDVSQEKEGDLRSEIKELQQNIDELEDTASKYFETAEKLGRAEETNRHLMEQLDAAESNEEVVEAMENQREQQRSQIENLRKQIQELEEHVQVTDELENFHIDEEKRLLAQLDEQEAMLNDRENQKAEQDRTIEDLEYTLGKFRSVVQGLQSDIDEARRSREISEVQAHEMSSKSKAMMDLNLRLQNSAAKTQTKTVDIEMGRVRADLASKHVEILSLFLPESFESERNPILAFLAFGRLRAKANLVTRMLGERLRERGHLNSGEETLAAYEILERIEWIEGLADRFERFLVSCSTAEFSACSNVAYELEPVERTMTTWIEALRRDELASDGPDHLKRMQEILADLAEKTISQNAEAKANELVARSKMVENYCEGASSILLWLAKFVQSKLGSPKDEDEDSTFFDKKMDQLGTKARTIRYLCSKVTQELDRVRSSSMCLGETIWSMFEEAEHQAADFAKQVRGISAAVIEDSARLERDEPLSYATVMNVMNKASHSNPADEDVFSTLTTVASSLQNQVDTLGNKSTDLSAAIEFEPRAAPWTTRAKELKAQKVVSSEIQEELTQLQRRNAELASRITDKEKTIEEMTIRVQLAEKRMKDTRLKDQQDKAIKDELDQLRTDKERVESELSTLQATIASNKQQMDKDRQELEVLRQGANSEVVKELGVGKVDETVMKNMKAAVKALENELVGLQSTVRYLRAENRQLQVPVQVIKLQAAKEAWLDPAYLQSKAIKMTRARVLEESQREALKRQVGDVEDHLIEVARGMKPVRLRRAGATTSKTATDDQPIQPLPSSWRSIKDTTRYQVLQQREEIEKWDAWREDLIRQAKITRHGDQTQKQTKRLRKPTQTPVTTLPSSDDPKGTDLLNGSVVKRPVKIVET